MNYLNIQKIYKTDENIIFNIYFLFTINNLYNLKQCGGREREKCEKREKREKCEKREKFENRNKFYF